MISDIHIDTFFHQQLIGWAMANDNYKALESIHVKEISLKDSKIQIQFNPHRIRSTAAKVDEVSIKERACFLCDENLPIEQLSHRIIPGYKLLVNPYPIFEKHFTIPSVFHESQRLISRINDMLLCTNQLPGYVVFYNGPECGASAPDHVHFQAVPKNALSIVSDFTDGKWQANVFDLQGFAVSSWRGYSRGILSLWSESINDLVDGFNKFFVCFNKDGNQLEPKLNVLCYLADNRYVIHVIPRKKHRSHHYYLESDNKLVISPAAIDLSGVLVIPRLEDFNKLTSEIVAEIFSEVTWSDDEIERLLLDFANSYDVLNL